LHAGLDRQDGGRNAEALKESGIPFDVNSGGKPVVVRDRESAPAQSGKLENMTGDSIPLANSGYICRSLNVASPMAKPARPALPPRRRFNCGRMAVSSGVVAQRRAVSMTDGIKAGTRAALYFAIRVEETHLAKQMHELAPSWSLA
jgi:hypothetical protein